MTKSYWLKKISIPNADLFLEYIRTVLPWIKSVGGIIVKRDLIQESTSNEWDGGQLGLVICLLYTSPSPRDVEESRMPSSA